MLFGHDTVAIATFRAEVRGWLAENLPDEYRDMLQCLDPRVLRDWHKRLYARGWVAPNWPVEHGGMGATLDQYLVLLEELTRAGAPYLLPTGLTLLAPALMAFGTPEQQCRHLPLILSGEVFWAQGYSEPNAGSDLASLTTRAVRCGSEFVVTGQKIWSSYAHFADWMFALVRTDPEATPRHAGITMLLIDLRSPGVTIRPIRTIADQDEFAMVDFDAVRVPEANVLGALGGGWKIANHVLVWERLSNGSPRLALMAWRNARTMARASGRDHDPPFRDRLAQLEIRLVAYLACYRNAIERVKHDQPIDALAPVMKIASTELAQRLGEMALEAAGPLAATERIDVGGGDLAPVKRFLLARRSSIYGGSNEIQRNLVATRQFGFPKAW